MEAFREYLASPIDGSQLSLFRMTVWFVIFFYNWRDIQQLKFHFSSQWFYCPFDWTPFIKPYNKLLMSSLIYAQTLSAICISIGFFYKSSIIIFFISYSYIFLADKYRYNNHYYLILLLTFLLFFTDGNAVFSVDNYLKLGSFYQKAQVPKWHLAIFQAQFFIIYTMAGINRLNYDWRVRAEPLKSEFLYFKPKISIFHKKLYGNFISLQRYSINRTFYKNILLPILQHPLSPHIASIYAIILDFTLLPLLFIFPHSLIPMTLFIFFNLLNKWFYGIGVFPALNIASLPILLLPIYSQEILKKLGEMF